MTSRHPNRRRWHRAAALPLLVLAAPAGAADEPLLMDEVSVTATRVERRTRDVPMSISVADKERIDKARMFHIKEILKGTPGVLIDAKNGGYDNRLVIRGAGQKANYGVREVMVLRDGVPMTDPDSFTRFDFIDTQDIERLEVTRGPGSIHGAGSAGGTIQILSKSVFDETANNARAGFGTSGATNAHGRVGGMISDSNALALTVSRRAQENHWRRWNEFESTQASLKHGYLFDDGGTWESEISYSASNLQLPGAMNEAQFEEFKETGQQDATKDPWKHTGRDSKILFLNSRGEKPLGNFVFKPQFYFTHWSHFHPVTGVINDSPDNMVYGTDLSASHDHQLLGPSSFIGGLTLRQDRSIDAEKYRYRDIRTVFGGRIVETYSDAKGDLMEEEDSVNTLAGLFVQETVRPLKGLLADASFRYDRSEFNIDTKQYSDYDYATGGYVAGNGATETDQGFNLFSARLGASYELIGPLSLYGAIAQSDQVPSASEIKDNTSLGKSTARNYEIGLKGRARTWSLDAALYHTLVSDEIVSVFQDGGTTFQNAGEVAKTGLELAGQVEVLDGLRLGASYAFSYYKFDEFLESINNVNTDQSGNFMPYVPRHQYGLSLDYRHPSGFNARIQTETWGEYWLDNSNTEKHGGYAFLTDLSLGYQTGQHSVAFNVENLFDKHYASEVKKDTRGTKSHYAGQPRTLMLTYRYAM